MGIKTKSDSNLVRVLQDDGVPFSELQKYENCSTVNLKDLRENEDVAINYEDLRNVCRNMTYFHTRAGKNITSAGDCGQHYFILLRGQVCLYQSKTHKIKFGQNERNMIKGKSNAIVRDSKLGLNRREKQPNHWILETYS